MVEYCIAQLLLRMKSREWTALKLKQEKTGKPIQELLNQDLKIEERDWWFFTHTQTYATQTYPRIQQ